MRIKNDFDCCYEIDNLISNTNIDIGIVIVWDNNYNNKIIEDITKNSIELIYSKKIETTLQFTENLLRGNPYGKTLVGKKFKRAI